MARNDFREGGGRAPRDRAPRSGAPTRFVTIPVEPRGRVKRGWQRHPPAVRPPSRPRAPVRAAGWVQVPDAGRCSRTRAWGRCCVDVAAFVPSISADR